MWNTVAIAVPAGSFLTDAQGTFSGTWPWTRDINWALDPLALLGPTATGGPAGADLRLPSRIVLDVLADLFLRPATVFPQLSLTQAFAQRLQAIRQAHLARFSADGVLRPEILESRTDAFLDLASFNRVAVTLEPVLGRTTPRLLPTQQACVLVGLIGALV